MDVEIYDPYRMTFLEADLIRFNIKSEISS